MLTTLSIYNYHRGNRIIVIKNGGLKMKNLLLNPKQYRDRGYPDERSKEIMLKTIAWFEEKGLAEQKEQYHNREFAEDFWKFMTSEGFFETLFLPKGYGSDPDQYYSCLLYTSPAG